MNATTSAAISKSRGVFKYIKAHKVWSIVIAVVVLGGGYLAYAHFTAGSVPTKYVLTTVQEGTIVASLSESGQVSASDQVVVNPKASGDITAVYAHDGEVVGAGQALAAIDSTDAEKTVRDAKANLESAQLSLAKLQEPADTLSMTEAQDALTNAQTDLQKTYQDGYSDVVSTYLSLAPIMTQLQDVVTGSEASRGTQWNIDYYRDSVVNAQNGQNDSEITSEHDATKAAYAKAVSAYNQAYADYQATNQSSSTSTVESTLTETYAMAQSVGDALNQANSFIQFYENSLKNLNLTPNSTADTELTTLNTDITKMNTQIATLLSDTNTITSDEQSITQNTESLQKLQAGPDTIDVQSDQLSLQKAQNSLNDAEDALADYTVTAPFSGTLANFDLHVGDNVGSGTAIATEISSGDIADLSLNEVDAAKVSAGQKATLTFDAIPDLSLTGTVASVSPLGAVSQGVVSYDVKIAFDTQDPRVKAGMTVNANIETAVHENVLMVPSSAVKTTGTQSYVLAFNPPIATSTVQAAGSQGITSSVAPVEIPVEIGISDNTNVEITSGLTLGEQVVARTASSGTTAAAAAATTGAAGGARGGFGGGGGGIRIGG